MLPRGALGVLETRGVAAQIAATDAMVKAAEVEVCGRQLIGSGWVSVVVAGQVGAVETAMASGVCEAPKHGELIGAEVVTSPDAAIDRLPHGAGLGDVVLDSGQALGILETRGIVQLVAGGDAAAKAANIQVSGWACIGGALCHLAIRGDLANVATAMQAGKAAAQAAGELYASLVVPQPATALALLLPETAITATEAVGAMGIMETTGYIGAVAAADAATKAAVVQVARFNVGSGGRIAVMITGAVGHIQAAMEDAVVAAKLAGGFENKSLVTLPDPQIVSCFAHTASSAVPQGSALGMIETRSTVALAKAMDEMIKGAKVAYEGSMKVGFYLTAGVVRGAVGDVKVALELGALEARRHGGLVATYLIPQPDPAMEPPLPHR